MSLPANTLLEEWLHTSSPKVPHRKRSRRLAVELDIGSRTTEEKRAAVREAIEASELDAMRFRFFFKNRGGCDLDEWRRKIDASILEEGK